MRPLEVLSAADYVLLETFRKDGTPVPTPVWAVRMGNELVIWTNPAAGKVKRLRRSSRVRVAPCDVRGTPRGRLIEGTARLRPSDDFPQVRAALVAKYGLQARLMFLPQRIKERMGRPVPAATIAVTIS